ncbi:hypothetical protein BRC86_01215 [Halobacteriales archaeon QS_3_64_16]|nr:MAG: hypothetical protein BRC86_01215 [Halobacteriales archaeon QS_3_64_16]
MNELTSRRRDAATPEERGQDGRPEPFDGRAGKRGQKTGRSRRSRSHDPVPDEIDVEGAPMAVDRCRYCGVVILDPGCPGGPCPGPNHTLEEFGVRPPADPGQGDRAVDGSGSLDPPEDDRRTVPPMLASR